MEGIENFFKNIFSAIGNFFISIWDFIIDALNMIFPRDFSTMIAIALSAISAVAIFLAITKSKN